MSEERTRECEVVVTRSGARAMRDIATGELMHPVVGPLVEAEELYIGPSHLEDRLERGSHSDEPLRLLDVGLGAGSNAVLAWGVSERMRRGARRLAIVSFENNLAALRLALEAEHAAAFGFEPRALSAGRALLEGEASETARTSWRLVKGELPETLGREPAASADVVFWDPFSPRANALLWTTTAFVALRRLCRDGATVHTYSAATATRSALLLAGFAVGEGDGAREEKRTTQAAVALKDITRPLDRRWLERLRRSSAPFPADAPPDAMDRVAASPQFALG